MSLRATLPLVFGAFLLLTASCRKQPQIKTYRIPKEDTASQAEKLNQMANALKHRIKNANN